VFLISKYDNIINLPTKPLGFILLLLSSILPFFPVFEYKSDDNIIIHIVTNCYYKISEKPLFC